VALLVVSGESASGEVKQEKGKDNSEDPVFEAIAEEAGYKQ
jgi:hypothetical protein